MEDRSSDGRRWQTARPRRYGGFISFITQARSVLTTWRHHAAEEAGAHTCVYRHAHAHSQTHIHTCIDMDTQDIHTGADTHTHTHTQIHCALLHMPLYAPTCECTCAHTFSSHPQLHTHKPAHTRTNTLTPPWVHLHTCKLFINTMLLLVNLRRV